MDEKAKDLTEPASSTSKGDQQSWIPLIALSLAMFSALLSLLVGTFLPGRRKQEDAAIGMPKAAPK